MRCIFSLIVMVLASASWADNEVLLQAGMRAYSSGTIPQARQFWQALATAGHAEAQLFLAHSYAQGPEQPRDYATAARWYQAAAAQGLPEAQYQLGLLYETGLGVPKNPDQAHYWYQQVTAQGFCPGTLNPAGRLE